MYNAFSLGWVEFEEKISKNLSVIFFWKLLESFMCISYHENWFSVVFLQKISSFSAYSIYQS